MLAVTKTMTLEGV